jgi:hypothetical protein
MKRDPSRKTIHSFMNKHRKTGLLIDKKQNRKYLVLAEGKLDGTLKITEKSSSRDWSVKVLNCTNGSSVALKVLGTFSSAP